MKVYYLTILLISFLSYFAQYFYELKTFICIEKKFKINISIIFIFIIFLILATVAGLRWRVGTDYGGYALNYRFYQITFLDSIKSYNEPGIHIIAVISKYIYDDYATMFFLASFITILLFTYTITKYSNHYLLSFFLLVFIGSWHGTFNGVRQYIACAIVFASLSYIINRKFIIYLLCILIAASFHISAISMIVLYFIPLKKISIWQSIFIIIGSAALISSYDIIFNIIANIKETDLVITPYMTQKINIFRIIVTFAPILVYFLFSKKDFLPKRDYFLINTLFLNAGIMIFTSNSAYLGRLGIYTNIFNTLAFPKILNGKDKYLNYLLIVIIFFLYGFYWYYDVYKDPSLNNFEWIFNRTNVYNR